MSEQESPFIAVPAEWQTPHSVAVTSFLYMAHRYTVSTVDLATTENYALLQALAEFRDELKPGGFLPSLRYETRVFMDGEDASMFKAVYESREEAEAGHQQTIEVLKRVLRSKAL